MPPDQSLDYQSYLSWTYFSEQALDRAEYTRFEATIRGTRRFIDVGASHGIYTFLANKALSNAEIISVEADPERFAILRENAKKWQTKSTNKITCINAAASDEQDRTESKEVIFYTTGTQISGGLFSVKERSDDYSPIRVPLLCIDDFFEPDVKTFIKIDVEGAELRVLKGATKHIESGKARFFTEISWWGDRDRGTTALDVLRFCNQARLRVSRRLRSDYLMAPEPDPTARKMAIARCLPPLLTRVIYNSIIPQSLRTWRERRENRRRLSRFDGKNS
jgi:FkbM family methyltransferase